MRHALLATAMLTAAALAQTAPSAPAAFTALRAGDSYRHTLTELAELYGKGLSTPCQQVELEPHSMRARVYGPLQLDPQGNLLTATWKESIQGTACGQAHLYNSMILIRQGKLQALPLFPGHSFAGSQLQHDAVLYAAAATAAGKNCSLDILDTSLPNGDPTRTNEPWDEKWTLGACGKRFLVTLHFLPDATGTTIQAGFRETVVLP